jgi:hypothetical protein
MNSRVFFRTASGRRLMTAFSQTVIFGHLIHRSLGLEQPLSPVFFKSAAVASQLYCTWLSVKFCRAQF